MKERPILLNAEMVRAVLDGRKTQTRRMVANVDSDNCLALRKPTKTRNGIYTHAMDAPKHGLCPFGAVGDRLWVRETFATLACGSYEPEKPSWSGSCQEARYRATDRLADLSADIRGYGWRPSIHMPRWASRITLEITGVRVERLNGISETDAEAEGIDMEALFDSQDCYDCIADHNMTGRPTATGAFKYLWESIYGEESWQANPWVWVIEFKRVEGEVI